jgi:hypothetical protein
MQIERKIHAAAVQEHIRRVHAQKRHGELARRLQKVRRIGERELIAEKAKLLRSMKRRRFPPLLIDRTRGMTLTHLKDFLIHFTEAKLREVEWSIGEY